MPESADKREPDGVGGRRPDGVGGRGPDDPGGRWPEGEHFKFAHRRQAGKALASRLIELCRASAGPLTDAALQTTPAVVLALPRGGVPVGFEVARALRAPLDVILARKIGAPHNPELGIGAVAEGGVQALIETQALNIAITAEDLERSISIARAELAQSVRLYRAARPSIDLSGMKAIVVDDGLATGATATAAVKAAKAFGARSVILAAPVGAKRTVKALSAEVDALVCVLEPELMWAIGMWYEDFSQVSAAEVLALLRASTQTTSP